MEETLSTKQTGQLDKGSVVCNIWSATNQLRWKHKEVVMIDGTSLNISELQQMWQSSNGELKGEAVPFVE